MCYVKTKPMKSEPLGTEYCPNCAIIKEKLFEIERRENIVEKREKELDQILEFINNKKLISH